MRDLADCTLSELLDPRGLPCRCGRRHTANISRLFLGADQIRLLPKLLDDLGLGRPYLLCGPYGYEAAGKAVCSALEAAHIPFCLHVIEANGPGRLKPDEHSVGSACLHFDHRCDCVIAVGSGVISDTAKVFSKTAALPLLTVATAPSMDGYASDNASMEVDGIKLSLAEQTPCAVVCDTNVLSRAPLHMIRAGLGDILAKTTALCDWRLSQFITGEYYCDSVAALVDKTLRRTIEAAPDAIKRRPEAIAVLTEGLLLSGIAIAFAGTSHPASGLDHYFSHCWEMMCLERGREYELHGVQVGVGMLLTLKLAAWLKTEKPSMARAEAAADRFDASRWEANLRRIFPHSADELLKMEARARKNERSGRLARAGRAIEHWEEICAVLDSLPDCSEATAWMQALGLPVSAEELGLSRTDAVDAFVCSRDIRNKYLLSSLIWDLGYMEEYAQRLSSDSATS